MPGAISIGAKDMGQLKIESIEKLKKKDYKLIMDDESELVIHEDQLVKYQLYKGKGLSTVEFQELKRDAEKQGLMQAAFRLIQFRSRTAKELRTKLIEKGFSEDAISELIVKLTSDGYVNHKEYAEQFVHDAIHLKKKGLKWARYELQQRGIESEWVEEAIASIDGETEVAQLFAVAERKWDNYVRKYGDTYETKLRMRHFLEQKGCSRAAIQSIMHRLEC